MKPFLVSSGEPAGIGPDLCLALAGSEIPVVVYGDIELLQERAKVLGKPIVCVEYQADKPISCKLNHLTVCSYNLDHKVSPGVLDVNNASYVMHMLEDSVKRCLAQEFSGLITAPVNKSILNQAGFSFTGHTELLAKYCDVSQVVMLMASPQLKIALVTTHVPLKDVASLITKNRLITVIHLLHHYLIKDFGIAHPKIFVTGLNPHAGESGYLGREEMDVIEPVLGELRQDGLDVRGPYPADTIFSSYSKEADVFVAMYHDQGLPVLKYASFGQSVNVTLGLPIIRTSVDHGTALPLAASGFADPKSLLAAVTMAYSIAKRRQI